MPPRMSGPYKHGKSGVYWLRRGVPAPLRALVGKTEEKRSLGTSDLGEARLRYAKAMAEIESRWANLRRGTQTLTERRAHELASPLFGKWLELYEDDPSSQPWFPEYYSEIDFHHSNESLGDINIHDEEFGEILGRPINYIFVEQMRQFAISQAKFILDSSGLLVDAFSYLKLVKACAIALQRASVILAKSAETGEPVALDIDNAITRIPVSQNDMRPANPRHSEPAAVSLKTEVKSSVEGSNLSIMGLLSEWRDEMGSRRKPSTYDSYSHTLRVFVEFVGHDDATKINNKDVIAFKNYRLSSPSRRTGKILSAKTVRDSDLAALKTIFGWAVDNRKLTSNPTSGIKVTMSKARRLRAKSLNDDEARAILLAASNVKIGPGSSKLDLAKRWVPWLCAFTGARVGELAQLRKEDIRANGDLWVLRITPEAGTVKSDEAREVVLHPQLIELGFPEFVMSAAAGHLFLTLRHDGDVLTALRTMRNRLAAFNRMAVPDRNVAPNHGFRHRFKTVGMEAGISTRVLDAIQGHAPSSVAESYGEVTLKAQAAAMSKIPCIDLS